MRTRARRAPDEVVDTTTAEPVVHEQATYTATPWSPAQLIGLVVGIGFVVLGIAALNQTGSTDLYSPHATVWHLGHSPLLGWAEIGFGVLLVLASVVPGAARSLMVLLGAVALTLGILIVADVATARLQRWLGVDDTNGWLYVVVGAVLVLTAFASPTFYGRRREATTPITVVRH